MRHHKAKQMHVSGRFSKTHRRAPSSYPHCSDPDLFCGWSFAYRMRMHVSFLTISDLFSINKILISLLVFRNS